MGLLDTQPARFAAPFFGYPVTRSLPFRVYTV